MGRPDSLFSARPCLTRPVWNVVFSWIVSTTHPVVWVGVIQFDASLEAQRHMTPPASLALPSSCSGKLLCLVCRGTFRACHASSPALCSSVEFRRTRDSDQDLQKQHQDFPGAQINLFAVILCQRLLKKKILYWRRFRIYSPSSNIFIFVKYFLPFFWFIVVFYMESKRVRVRKDLQSRLSKISPLEFLRLALLFTFRLKQMCF